MKPSKPDGSGVPASPMSSGSAHAGGAPTSLSSTSGGFRAVSPAMARASAGASWRSRFSGLGRLVGRASPHVGLLVFLLSLAAVSLLTGIRHTPGVRVYVEGDIAERDVMATQDLLVEDPESTTEKIKRIAESQPPIFDLAPDAAARLQGRLEQIFEIVNNATVDQLEEARWLVAETLNRELSRSSFTLLRDRDLQEDLLRRLVPWLGERLRQGVVLDERMLEKFPGGILVRDATLKAEALRADLAGIRDLRKLSRELEQHLRQDLGKSMRIRSAIMELMDPLLAPSLTVNPEASQARIREVMSSLQPVYYHIRKGEMVVRQGQRVSAREQLKLQALFSQAPEGFDIMRPLGVFIVGLLFACGLVVSPKGRFFKALSSRDAILLAWVVLLFAGGAKLLAAVEAPLSERLSFLSGDLLDLCVPTAGAGGLLALYFSPAACVSAGILLAFLCAQMVGGGLELFAFYFLGSIVATLLMKRAETRAEVLRSVAPLLGFLLLAWTGIHIMRFQGLSGMGVAVGFVLVHGLSALFCILALSPIVEMLLGYSSRFRFLEQMNLEQPLLQELMVSSPGTYHHSLIVGNMVEAAARAIGANALLCKVAALYHDIGKLKNPQYFIENQMNCRNKHDKLAPSMSALILVSHVKKGVELARKHAISQEIIDIIQQHHGTSLIRYFHAKAQEQALAKGVGEQVPEEDFRYPGPKPQTKEAGLVMLADAIEASGRTLVDPTPARIKAHVDQIIKTIFTDGQLDESELTLKDLTLASATFTRILNGIFHHRIEYPDARKDACKLQPDAVAPAPAASPAASPVSSPAAPAPAPPAATAEQPGTGAAEGMLSATIKGPLQ